MGGAQPAVPFAMSFRIQIENSGDQFSCDAGQNVLRAMECLGRKGIPVGCRGGGCGVCKVKVLEGSYRTEKMSRACVTQEEEGCGMALACKFSPTGDLRIDVVGKMARAVADPQAVYTGAFSCRQAVPTDESNEEKIQWHSLVFCAPGMSRCACSP